MDTKLNLLDRFFESKSNREIVILFILTVALVWFISSSYLLPKLDSKIASLKEFSGMNSTVKPDDTEQLLQTKSIESEKLKNKLDGLKNEYAMKKRAVESNQTLFLDEKTVNLFVNFLTVNFSKNGLQMESFKSTVSPLHTSSQVGRAIIEIEFTGDFRNLLYMLNCIENSSFSCAVDTLRIKKAKEQKELKISLYGLIK